MGNLLGRKKMTDFELRLWCVEQTAGMGTKFWLEEAIKLYRFMTSTNPLKELEEVQK